MFYQVTGAAAEDKGKKSRTFRAAVCWRFPQVTTTSPICEFRLRVTPQPKPCLVPGLPPVLLANKAVPGLRGKA